MPDAFAGTLALGDHRRTCDDCFSSWVRIALVGFQLGWFDWLSGVCGHFSVVSAAARPASVFPFVTKRVWRLKLVVQFSQGY